jgi:hypothetical protein
VEDLLEGLLAEIGTSPEVFFGACEKAGQNPQHKKIYDQIMAVDNFVAFKKLMVKRNTELNNQALKYNDNANHLGCLKLREMEKRLTLTLLTKNKTLMNYQRNRL